MFFICKICSRITEFEKGKVFAALKREKRVGEIPREVATKKLEWDFTKRKETKKENLKNN